MLAITSGITTIDVHVFVWSFRRMLSIHDFLCDWYFFLLPRRHDIPLDRIWLLWAPGFND